MMMMLHSPQAMLLRYTVLCCAVLCCLHPTHAPHSVLQHEMVTSYTIHLAHRRAQHTRTPSLLHTTHDNTMHTVIIITHLLHHRYVGCCGHTGSVAMALTRGGSVALAAVWAVAFQNFVFPWYTSSWALDQLGTTFQDATDLLAELVTQLYTDTHELMMAEADDEALETNKDAGCGGGGGGGGDGSHSTGSGGRCAAAAAAAAAADVPVQRLSRLALLNAAVQRALVKQQQQQQQQQEQQQEQQQQQQPKKRTAADQVSRRFTVESVMAEPADMARGEFDMLGPFQEFLRDRRARRAAENGGAPPPSQLRRPADADAQQQQPASSPGELHARVIQPLVQVCTHCAVCCVCVCAVCVLCVLCVVLIT